MQLQSLVRGQIVARVGYHAANVALNLELAEEAESFRGVGTCSLGAVDCLAGDFAEELSHGETRQTLICPVVRAKID